MRAFQYTNFTQCAANLLPLNESIQNGPYGWKGPARLIPYNASTQISTLGCKHLCGEGTFYYDWNAASGTLTTWVLPTIGILLQAPMTSNAFWETTFSIARWVGSPIASLAYILWNIKVSGKAAMMADMAGPYEVFEDTRESNFASMRDSLYLLSAANQYSIDPRVLRINRDSSKPAESLLRVALFSKDLRLLKRKAVLTELEHEQPVTVSSTLPSVNFDALAAKEFDEVLEQEGELNAMRQKLAQQLRDTRRRGVVPVFISTLWFLFALAISIQSAFGFLGENAVAHDLALGLLLAWLPIVIMCGIIDRNPVSADDIRKKINRLIDHVRKSLMDDTVRPRFLDTIEDVGERHEMRERIERLGAFCADMEGYQFFHRFSGQGRTRWHYGAAHGILCDIEDAWVAAHGRDWLRDEARARTYLVLGKPKGGLDWLDYREVTQITAAFICVFATVFGAWCISFYTPTVGLGCRSGGYTVFVAIATGLVIVEIFLWWYWDARKLELMELRRRATMQPSLASTGERMLMAWAMLSANLRSWLRALSTALLSLVLLCVPQPRRAGMEERWHNIETKLEDLSPQEAWDYLFFKPIESANTIWLLYRILAQTFGIDNTCECMTSTWAPGGGYLDLTQFNDSNSQYISKYWVAGTTLAVTVMGLAMLYIVLEWCLQSWISTAERKDAAQGLRRVRRFRRAMYPIRYVQNRLDDLTHELELRATDFLRALGLLSKDFEVRPVGLRWARKPLPREIASQTPDRSGSTGGSTVPLLRLNSNEGFTDASSPPHAHPHAARRLSDEESLSPEATPARPRNSSLSSPIQWRPTFERQSSIPSTANHSPARRPSH